MIELVLGIPVSTFIMFRYFRSKPLKYNNCGAQTEPGIWLPVISMELDDLPYSPIYNSDDDVIMSPVEIDSQNVMSYRDYCS